MATERIDIVISENGSRTVKRGLEGIGETAKRSDAGVALLKRTLLTLGAGFSLFAGIRTLADFGQEMSTVGAITRATESQFKALRDEAKRLGATTRFSATQAAEGAKFLARAGFDTDQVLGSLDSTLRLAQAGALDLGRAADIASNVLTGFRLKVSDAGRVVDVLAMAANRGNTDVNQLGDAMRFIAPVASGLRVPLEETTAAIVALSDAGLQGGMAGTGLRRILSELESPSRKTKQALANLGLTVNDVKVSQVGLTAALIKLREAGVDAGTGLEIFGDRGGPAFEVLSSSLPKVERLNGLLNDSAGFAEKTAKIMDQNLNGAFFAVKSATEALIIAFGDLGAENMLTTAFNKAAAAIRWAGENLGQLLEGFQYAIPAIVILLRGPLYSALMSTVGAVKAIGIAVAANPLGALIVAISLITAAVVAFTDESDKSMLNLKELGVEMKKAWEEIKPLLEEIQGILIATAMHTVKIIRGLKIAAGYLPDDDLIGREQQVTARIEALLYERENLIQNHYKRIGQFEHNFVAGSIDLPPATEGTQRIDAQINKLLAEQRKLRQELEELGMDFTIGAVHRSVESPTGGTAPALGGDGDAAAKAAEAAAKAAQRGAALAALAELRAQYDSVLVAQREYAAAVEIIKDAEKLNVGTTQERATVLAMVTKQLEDARDPLAALNREMEKESELLRMSEKSRAVETEVRRMQIELLQKGVDLGATELAQLRERVMLLQQDALASQERDAAIRAVTGDQEAFIAQLGVMNELVEAGTVSKSRAAELLLGEQATLLQGTIEAQQNYLEQYENTYNRIEELRANDLISEQTAQQLKARAQAETNAQRLATARAFFGNLSVLARSENRELAAIGKAAAVTQATIDGVLAVQKALASAPPPANYALAAAVGVAAAANVAQILAANTNGYAFGGNFEVGGTGGTDSQLVAFRATPGEKVSISTPQQERDREREAARRGDGGGGGTNVINVLDPALLQDYLTTQEGERVLVNVIRRNRNSIGLR